MPIRLFSTLSTSPTCSEQHAKLDAVVFPYIRLLCLLLSEIVCNFGATVAKTDNIRLVHRETTFYFMFTGIELYEMTHSHHNSSLLSNSFCFFVSSLVYWPVFVAFALPIIVTFTLPVMSLNTGGLDSSFDPPGWNLTNASRSQLMSLCGQWGIRAKRKTIDTVQMIRRMVREQRRSVPIQKYLTNAPGNVTCIDDASRKRRESNYEGTLAHPICGECSLHERRQCPDMLPFHLPFSHSSIFGQAANDTDI